LDSLSELADWGSILDEHLDNTVLELVDIVLTAPTSAVEFVTVIRKEVIAKMCKSKKQVIEVFVSKKN
jgi:hypothetical protein